MAHLALGGPQWSQPPESPTPKLDSLGVFQAMNTTMSLHSSKFNISESFQRQFLITSLFISIAYQSPHETLSLPAPPDLASNSAVSQRKPRPTPPVRSSELCIGSWPNQARYPVEPQWIGIYSATGHHGQFNLDSAPRTLSNGLRVPNNTLLPAIASYYNYRKDRHTSYRCAKSALDSRCGPIVGLRNYCTDDYLHGAPWSSGWYRKV